MFCQSPYFSTPSLFASTTVKRSKPCCVVKSSKKGGTRACPTTMLFERAVSLSYVPFCTTTS